MKIKICKIIPLILILSLILTGCTSDKKEKVEQSSQIENPNGLISYVLSSKNGVIKGFDIKGNEVDEITLGGAKSDFLVAMDEGFVYSEEFQNKKTVNKVLYCVDKKNGKLFILKVEPNKITKIKEKSLKDKNIDSISGYNGIFGYLVKNKNSLITNLFNDVKKVEYIKSEKTLRNGRLEYDYTYPVNKNKNQSNYLFVENFTKEYVSSLGIENVKLLDPKFIPKKYDYIGINQNLKGVYKIPFNINSWKLSNENVFIFGDGVMGRYSLSKNKLGLYYAPEKNSNTDYIDGLKSGVYSLYGSSNIKESIKSYLLKMNPKDLRVEKVLQIEENNPTGLTIDKNGYIYTVFENTKGGTYLSKVKVYDNITMTEKGSFALQYIPQKISSARNDAYLINENEDFLIYIDLVSKTQHKYRTNYPKAHFNNVFAVNFDYQSDFNFKNGKIYNLKGELINELGELINENNKKINTKGQLIDEYGRGINEKGKLIDYYNNIIDETGKILEYVKDEKGLYHNSKGEVVNNEGVKLTYNVISRKYYTPEELIPITWTFDRNGNLIVFKGKEKEIISKSDLEKNKKLFENIKLQADKYQSIQKEIKGESK